MKADIEKKVSAFRKVFPDESACIKVLAGLKWEQGFVCRKCGHSNYCAGKTLLSRRCTRCKTEESVTAHTVFHHCKIPLNKAFEIAFMVCNKPDISSYEISRRLDMRHMTCYDFRKKIMNCRKSFDKKNLLEKVLNNLNEKVETLRITIK